jgi:hypothetical protein
MYPSLIDFGLPRLKSSVLGSVLVVEDASPKKSPVYCAYTVLWKAATTSRNMDVAIIASGRIVTISMLIDQSPILICPGVGS